MCALPTKRHSRAGQLLFQRTAASQPPKSAPAGPGWWAPPCGGGAPATSSGPAPPAAPCWRPTGSSGRGATCGGERGTGAEISKRAAGEVDAARHRCGAQRVHAKGRGHAWAGWLGGLGMQESQRHAQLPWQSEHVGITEAQQAAPPAHLAGWASRSNWGRPSGAGGAPVTPAAAQAASILSMRRCASLVYSCTV